MFNAIDEVFEYDGVKLVAAKVPKQYWPCQNCALYDKCCDNYGKEDFPACKAKQRKDKQDVVFFEWFDVNMKRR